jgi:hypothetical protein
VIETAEKGVYLSSLSKQHSVIYMLLINANGDLYQIADKYNQFDVSRCLCVCMLTAGIMCGRSIDWDWFPFCTSAGFVRSGLSDGMGLLPI